MDQAVTNEKRNGRKLREATTINTIAITRMVEVIFFTVIAVISIDSFFLRIRIFILQLIISHARAGYIWNMSTYIICLFIALF